MVDRYWELLRLSGNRQALIDLANTPRDRNAWEKLSDISMPSLVIWGQKDGLLPMSMAAIFDREIDDVRVVMLKNIGHLPMEEAVDEVSDRIINFCMATGC
jgi:pimeloyl-ACP methyl ester carboxylesterase